jgi:hypothetical protein
VKNVVVCNQIVAGLPVEPLLAYAELLFRQYRCAQVFHLAGTERRSSLCNPISSVPGEIVEPDRN